MFRTLEDFYQIYSEESQGTLKLLNALTDESLATRATPDGRSLGETAWHIAATIPEMIGKTKLPLSSLDEDAPVPTTAAAIVDGYAKASEELIQAMKANWTDETLYVVDNMYGMEWPRSRTLGCLCAHENHHRGQLTILMRIAGLKVPGTMGPAKEEWAAFGMPAPAY